LELILYGRGEEDRLLELLLQVTGRLEADVKAMKRPWKVALLIQKVPHDFQKWLDSKFSLIRSLGIQLDLFLIITADAWPAPWDRARNYF